MAARASEGRAEALALPQCAASPCVWHTRTPPQPAFQVPLEPRAPGEPQVPPQQGWAATPHHTQHVGKGTGL